MRRISIVFFQVVIILIGISALVFMLWEPHLEGRNVNATPFDIYFKDPFLAYAYFASIFFFMALYQVFKLLGFIGKNETFSERAVKALRTIKHCAMTLIAFILGAEGYIIIVQRQVEEDIAGGVAMGLLLILVSTIVAIAAAVFEKRLQTIR